MTTPVSPVRPSPARAAPGQARPVFSNRKPRKLEPVGLPSLDRVLQATALGAALTVVIVLALNPVSSMWHAVISRLIELLSLDAHVVQRGMRIGQASLGQRLGISMHSEAPDWFALTLHCVMSIGIFGMSWAVRSMPLRCGLRILCGLHGLGLLMIALQGDKFPYTLLEHTSVLYDSAMIWFLLTPGLLAAGFFLVERAWLNRLAASVYILGFQVLALPLKLVLHSVLVSVLSPAAIPLLFLAAGPVLDIFLLAALYAWVLTWPQLKLKAG